MSAVQKGHFTILTGPPRSGKSEYRKALAADSEVPYFVDIEGHGEVGTINAIQIHLAVGTDVVYETTAPLLAIPPVLLNRADTIEIFRHDPNKE